MHDTSLCPGLSVSVASVGWWVGTILSGEISPFLLSSRLGTAGTLLLHAVICALSFIFVLLFLPETKVKLWHLRATYRFSILIELFYWSYCIVAICIYTSWGDKYLHVCLHLAAIESGAGGPTVLHPLVTEDQPSLLSHVRIIINTSSF